MNDDASPHSDGPDRSRPHSLKDARTPTRRLRSLLLAVCAVFVGASAAVAQQRGDALLRAADASRAKGADDAPITVFEIGDFQCPFCARFSREVFPKIDSAYIQTGKVNWVFINYPIPSHPRAWAAAEAAVCAGAVADRFWAMHDRLYERQEEWSNSSDLAADLERYARDAEIPAGPMQGCMERDDLAPMLVRDLMSATSAGIEGTPTFFINQERTLVGMHGFDEWKTILDGMLAGQNE